MPAFCSDACKQACWRHRAWLRRTDPRELKAFDQRRSEGRTWWRRWGANRAERQAHWRAQQARWRREEERWAWEEAEWEAFDAHRRAKPLAHAMSVSEARARVFDLAGLDDDRTLSLRTAWRAAAQRHHPDFGGKTTTMQELVDLKELLHT